MSSGVYIFGIIDCPREQDLGNIGFGDPPGAIRLLAVGEITAIIGEACIDVSLPEHADVITHQKVLEHALRDFTVLPMRFGMIATDEEEARTILQGSYDDLYSELKRLQGTSEAGLKVFWRKEAMQAQVEKKFGPVQDGKKENDAENYRIMVKVGQYVQGVVEEWKNHYTSLIVKKLGVFAEETKINDVVGVQMLLNAAFLLRDDKMKAFEDELDRLARAYADELSFRYVVPLPPYNFVDLQLQTAGQGVER